ncbi:transporter substrate-binding domain-containing protein [Rhodoferax sp. OV413]|uniref:transporter substrate-binding domain-containing protein n=1 Tax=Rhodoferax sp. OV413 TaxID=1855285 RepID=UPI000B8445D7|nr:transporter substrate-binding domain-containing protein [Rhodoferax sp. OV413]
MKTSQLLSASLLALGFLASAAPVQAKDWKTVTIATEGAYEPWNLTLPGGKLGGFEIDMIEDLCPRMKITCKLVVQNWDGMIAGLKAGKYDVMMDSIVITDERKKEVAFSAPYASTSASFVAASGKLLPEGKGDTLKLGTDAKTVRAAVEPLRAALKGKTIGIASGTVYTKFIDEHFKDIATVREYSASADTMLDLKAGRIDAAFDDVTLINSILAKPENKGLAYSGPKIGGLVFGEGEALGFRKADADLKALFDVAIKAALADGTMKKLSLKWFKTDLTPATP